MGIWILFYVAMAIIGGVAGYGGGQLLDYRMHQISEQTVNEKLLEDIKSLNITYVNTTVIMPEYDYIRLLAKERYEICREAYDWSNKECYKQYDQFIEENLLPLMREIDINYDNKT